MGTRYVQLGRFDRFCSGVYLPIWKYVVPETHFYTWPRVPKEHARIFEEQWKAVGISAPIQCL